MSSIIIISYSLKSFMVIFIFLKLLITHHPLWSSLSIILKVVSGILSINSPFLKTEIRCRKYISFSSKICSDTEAHLRVSG